MRLGVAHAVHHARAPRGVRQAAARPAADAQRAGRPCPRVRGRDDRWRSGWPARSTAPRAATRPSAAFRAGRPRRRQVLGLQALADRTPPRRWNAWAATATSRSRACRGCTARRRSSRSGRARATSPRWTRCAPWSREPEALDAFFAELELAAGTDPRYDDALAMLRKELADAAELEFRARRVVERMALLLQGALLLRHGTGRGRRRVRALAAGRRLGRRLRHAARRGGHRRDPRPGQLIRGRSSLGTDSSRIRLFGPLVGTVLISSRVGRTAARGEFAPAIL